MLPIIKEFSIKLCDYVNQTGIYDVGVLIQCTSTCSLFNFHLGSGEGFKIINFCHAGTYRRAISSTARLAQSVEHQTFKLYGVTCDYVNQMGICDVGVLIQYTCTCFIIFCQAATYRRVSSRRARLAQSVEHQTFKRYGARNLRVAGSNPSSGVAFVSQNTASVQWMSFIRLRLFSRRLRIEAVYVLSYKRSYYSRFSVVNHTLFYLVPRLFCQCKLSFFGLTASRLTSNDTSVPTSYKSLIFYT